MSDERKRPADCELMNRLTDRDAVVVVVSYGPGNGSHFHSKRSVAEDVAWLRAMADELEKSQAAAGD